MVSTFTPNVGIEEPARGDYVGTWDTPVNANMTLLDLILGGRTTINGAAGSVVLSAAQFQCKTITINSTLIASITLTFPTSFTKSYEIYNACTGSSNFVVTLLTTVTGGQAVCPPPGEICEVVNDGTNIRFKNLGRVGEYWDYAGSSVPNWVTFCTVPPYLNCDGSTFSSATYPQLAVALGSTTLPDSRSRMRIPLAQGATRVTSAVSGVPSGTFLGSGGDQNAQAHSHVININDSGHTHTYTKPGATGNTGGGGAFGNAPVADVTGSATTGITATSNNTFTGTSANMPPVLVHGITMVRAA